MEKRKDINIYIMGFKPLKYGYWDNELYTPLECGYATRTEHFTGFGDNTGDNISKDNEVYLETTAIYWIWKNVHTKFKGQCQYRRRLKFEEDYDFEKDFEEYDLIAAEPLRYNIMEQYTRCHNRYDLETVIDILKERYDDTDFFFKQNDLYYSNGFIMKEKDYDTYCEWLFGILDEWKKRMGFDGTEDIKEYVRNRYTSKAANYQQRLFGYLSERLLSYYIFHNEFKVKKIKYEKFEGITI